MVDSVPQIDLIEATIATALPNPVAIDVDAGWWWGRADRSRRPKRSPGTGPPRLAASPRDRRPPGTELVGLMAYEGQIAGVGDRLRSAVPKCRHPLDAVPLRSAT